MTAGARCSTALSYLDHSPIQPGMGARLIGPALGNPAGAGGWLRSPHAGLLCRPVPAFSNWPALEVWGIHDPGFILGYDQAVDVEPKLFADLSVVSDSWVKNYLDAAVEIEADRGNHALEAGHSIPGAIPKDG